MPTNDPDGPRVVSRKSLKSLRRVVLKGGRVVSCITLKSKENFWQGGVPISKDIGGYGSPLYLDNLDDLAERVERLSPSPRYPDRFHEEKSEIAERLRQLALERGRRG